MLLVLLYNSNQHLLCCLYHHTYDLLHILHLQKHLNKNNIILNMPVSIGLGKYYEFILKKMDGLDIPQPTEDELKAIEEEEKQELKDQMLEYIKNDVTIH